MSSVDGASLRAARAELLIENKHLRVFRYTIEPGTHIGHHRHARPYLVTTLAGGRLIFSDAAGDRAVEIPTGQVAFHPAGIEHDISNHGPDTVVNIEAELKGE